MLPGTEVSADRFWQGYAALLDGFAAENRALLDRRAELQARIDDWQRRAATRTGTPPPIARS